MVDTSNMRPEISSVNAKILDDSSKISRLWTLVIGYVMAAAGWLPVTVSLRILCFCQRVVYIDVKAVRLEQFTFENFIMYEMYHPVFHEMSRLGCTDDSKYTLAFQTYMELCEVKRLWDVNYKYNKALDLIYLEARNSKSSQLDKYIPWPAMNALSLNQIEIMQKKLETDRLIFVFKDGDSTSVYYTVTAGLVKPSSPEQSKAFKQKEEKKAALESEIRKNASNLYELAMSMKTEDDPMNETPTKD